MTNDPSAGLAYIIEWANTPAQHSTAPDRYPYIYESPLNAYRAPGVIYDPNVKQININGETYYCSFGNVTNCGQ